MSDTPISSLPAATTVSGTDQVALVQAGVTKRAPLSLLPVPSAPGTISVDSFLAKGDGTSDDIAAIRNAIAALPDGGTLMFTPGKTYLVSAPVEVKNKTRITVVMSGAAITSTGTSDSSAVVHIVNVLGLRVVGGHLTHKNQGTRKFAADGLSVENCSNVLIEHVHVGYVYSMGIRVAGCVRAKVVNCVVNGSTADGIGVYGGERYSAGPTGSAAVNSTTVTCTDIRFQAHDVGAKLTLSGAGPSGADLVTTITARIADTQVTVATAASTAVSAQFVRLQRHSSQIVFADNSLTSCGDDSISSVGYLFYPSPNTDITVTGNTIVDGRARGILWCGTDGITVTGNALRSIKMGGIFGVVETGSGNPTTYGNRSAVVVGNALQSICTDFANGANYPAIGAVSDSDTYPIDGMLIADNIIRDAYSNYISAGAYGSSNTPLSCKEITIRDNDCLDGNRNNGGIYALRATNVLIVGNRVSRARTAAINTYDAMAGHVIVHDNVLSNWGRDGGGSAAIALSTTGSPSNVVYNNTLNGTLVASGTTGGGANPGGTAA